MHIINIEAGMPISDIAINNLSSELRIAKAQNKKIVKIIHGWGSSGKGGKIKIEAQKTLEKFKKSGRIKDFLPGEEFTPFDSKGRKFLSEYPELRKDHDYSRGNMGITIVIL